MMWRFVFWGFTLWASCVLYLYPLKHRPGFKLRLCGATAAAAVVTLVCGMVGAEGLFTGWHTLLVPFGYFFLCCLFIGSCAAMPIGAAVYCAVWAVITQQVAYEAAYLLFDMNAGLNLGAIANEKLMPGILSGEHKAAAAAAFVGIQAAVYAAAGATIVRYMPEKGIYQVGPRQLSSALLLLVVFEILIQLLRSDTLEGAAGLNTLNLLLVQCYCVMILYLQNALFKKSAMKQELDTLNQLWHQQKEHYELSRETIRLINHKCHDLKHQIAAIRAISGAEEREKYLGEMEASVQIYDSMVQTGNEVLDTVLTEKSLFCAANYIKVNCIADGRRMDVFDPVDVYTVFGNSIDNAIESVKQLKNREMRMIDVLVYVRRQFLMINIMNPISGQLEFEGELPLSTKAHNGFHGFGLKSIRHTVSKYNGFMKIDTAEHIFSLKILIPLTGGGEKQIPQKPSI